VTLCIGHWFLAHLAVLVVQRVAWSVWLWNLHAGRAEASGAALASHLVHCMEMPCIDLSGSIALHYVHMLPSRGEHVN